MLVMPGETVRIANDERVSLGLDADVEAHSVRLTPRFGDAADIEAGEDGLFPFPTFPCPNEVAISWLSSSGDALFRSRAIVCDRHYFPLSALSGYGHGSDDFDELPEDDLRRARQAATEVFEEAAHRAFVRRIGRVSDFGGDGLLNAGVDPIREVLTPGYRQAGYSLIERDGRCGRAFPCEVEFVYGRDEVPAEVSRAVLELAAYTLRPSNRPVGATGESTDAGGYIHFITAGRDGATAVPEVNAAIEMFGRGEACVW